VTAVLPSATRSALGGQMVCYQYELAGLGALPLRGIL